MVRFVRNILIVTAPSLLVLIVVLELFFRFAIPAFRGPRACFDETEKIFKFCFEGEAGTATFGRFAQQRGRWRINNAGWNSPVDYFEKKTTPRIAVIGDSYIEAFQVDADRSYPSLMRAALAGRFHVYSFGMSGASLAEYLNMSRYADRRFDPDVLIFNVVHNDFLESVHELNPEDVHQMTLSVRDSVVEEVPPRPNPAFAQYSWKKRLFRESAIVRYVVFNLKIQQFLANMRSKPKYVANVEIAPVQRHRDAIERAVEYVVGRIAEENRGRRIVFVMSAPNKDVYEGTVAVSRVVFLNEMLQRACLRHGVESLDLTPAMTRDYETHRVKFNSEYDGHWNDYGHRFVCEQVLGLGFGS